MTAAKKRVCTNSEFSSAIKLCQESEKGLVRLVLSQKKEIDWLKLKIKKLK